MDKMFSLDEFSRRGMGSTEAEALSQKLSEEISNRLHNILIGEIDQIRLELNELGHKLELYYQPSPGDISYRDNENDTKPCKLRLGVDTIVSVGFGDTIEE